jgi:hypothetical protein
MANKTIPLSVKAGPFTSVRVLSQVLTVSPKKGLDIDEIRRRCRIMNMLDEVGEGDSLTLRLEDHEILKAALESFQFSMATPELLQVIDDVLNAADAEKVPAPSKNKKVA